jgi:hypothetical protein
VFGRKQSSTRATDGAVVQLVLRARNGLNHRSRLSARGAVASGTQSQALNRSIPDLDQSGFFDRALRRSVSFRLRGICLGNGGAFFEAVEKVLYEILAIRLPLQSVMLDRNFQTILLCMVLMTNARLLRHE